MKTKLLSIIIAGLTLATLVQPVKSSIRSKINFNEDWKFILEDKAVYCSMDFDDSEWRTLDLPHDWSVEGEFSKEYSGRNAWLPGGIAWYRKSFELPEEYQNKTLEIQFDGVYKNATVWVNNHPVGKQHDGYTSFYFDITELLNFDKPNTIAVQVDNSKQPNCRWYSGSGIYRNVWLNVSSNTYVANWGTYITTPEISKEKASVKIVTTIENFDEAKELKLETIICDPLGKEVIRKASAVSIGNYRTLDFTQELSVPTPLLWGVDDPNIYSAKTVIKSNGKIIDEYPSTFGIRTINFDADKGFFLNGENMKMKGVCLHHEAGPLGAAVPKAIWKRRLENLKAIGCNAIRTAHNPASPEFMDLCDELGFLVMDEFVDKWENPYKKPKAKRIPFFDALMADEHFSEEWKKNIGETIRRDRNHPSVIMWSIGNENHSPGSGNENNGARMYGSFVRSMDPSRPVINGMERGRDMPVAQKVDEIIESCKPLDLIALNYGEQWCKLIHERKPGKAYLSTESYVFFNSALEKRFASIERSPWLDVMENDNNAGLFLWVGIDYLGESKTWGDLGTNCGLYDYAGFRKSISYLYESFWSDKPNIHLEVYEGDADDFSTSGRWWWPPMNEHWNLPKDSVVDLACYTNCEEVDLYLNHKKIGTQKLSDFPNWIMKWRKVRYKKGTLKAVGKIGGKAVCETKLVTSGKSHHLEVKIVEKDVNPGDIIHAEITLVDKKGNKITMNDQKLEFNLQGDGEIISLANGNMKDLTPFTNMKSSSTYLGRCLCVMKLGEGADESLSLTVSCEGLKSAILPILAN